MARAAPAPAIGDRGYVSGSMRKRLWELGLNFIARTKINMKEQNTPEELKLLERRDLVEHVFRKLKANIGDSFSRFRSWNAVCGIIGLSIMVINL